MKTDVKIRFDKASKAFRKSRRFQLLAKETQKYYTRSLNILDQHFGGCYVEHIGRMDVSRLMAGDHHDGIKNQTLSVGRVLFNFLCDEGYLSETHRNPFNGIKPIKLGKVKAWSQEDIERAKSRLMSSRARRLFYLLLYTGQRFSDVCSMKYGDIKLTDEGPFIEVKQSKTKRRLMVPMADDLANEIFSNLKDMDSIQSDPHRYIVSNSDKKSLTWTREVINSSLRMIGVTDIRLHGLRHNCACMLAEAGCTEHEIMSITGHKTSAMIQKYTLAARQKTMALSAMKKLGAVK